MQEEGSQRQWLAAAQRSMAGRQLGDEMAGRLFGYLSRQLRSKVLTANRLAGTNTAPAAAALARPAVMLRHRPSRYECRNRLSARQPSDRHACRESWQRPSSLLAQRRARLNKSAASRPAGGIHHGLALLMQQHAGCSQLVRCLLAYALLVSRAGD